MQIGLVKMNKPALKAAQVKVTNYHYLHSPVDQRTSLEGYDSYITPRNDYAGLLLFGRPEATRCGDWYGDVLDVGSGQCEVTRWQVLNLSRVWLHPNVQPGGIYFNSERLPGYVDRKGQFRSTLASSILATALERIGYDYLLARPPCFLDEPYEIRWLLSYCDTRVHKGTLYKAAGFELYRTNERGIQTWRKRLPKLTFDQNEAIQKASLASRRSRQYRGERLAEQAQLSFELNQEEVLNV